VGEKQTGDNGCWKKPKDAPQCGPVKPACSITTSFQIACYNLPVACPAPAPCLRSHAACVSLGTCFFHSHPLWPDQLLAQRGSKGRTISLPLLPLAVFPLFLPCIPKLDDTGKIAHLFLELKRLHNKGHPESNRMSLRRIRKVIYRWRSKEETLNKVDSLHVVMMSSGQPLGELN